jgi:hypothetical protein
MKRCEYRFWLIEVGMNIIPTFPALVKPSIQRRDHDGLCPSVGTLPHTYRGSSISCLALWPKLVYPRLHIAQVPLPS